MIERLVPTKEAAITFIVLGNARFADCTIPVSSSGADG
jgi:hypothetical protein